MRELQELKRRISEQPKPQIIVQQVQGPAPEVVVPAVIAESVPDYTTSIEEDVFKPKVENLSEDTKTELTPTMETTEAAEFNETKKTLKATLKRRRH